MKIDNFMKSDNGFALVFTLLLLVIILTLSSVLLNISLGEYKTAEYNKNDVRAYLLARSGAEIMANYLINKDNAGTNALGLNNLEDYEDNNNSYLDFNLVDDNDNNNEISYIQIIKNSKNDFDIISISNSKGVEDTVRVNVKKPNIYNTSIFAENSLDFSKMGNVDVDEDNPVATNGSYINDPHGYLDDNEKRVNANINYEPILWEDVIDNDGYVDINENKVENIYIKDIPSGENPLSDDTITNSEEYIYDKIKYNSGTLIIDFQTGFNDNPGDYHIDIAIEDDFTLKSDIIFLYPDTIVTANPEDDNYANQISKFTLNLYVKNTITFQTPNVVVPNINIFLMEDAELTLIGNSEIPNTTNTQGIFVYGPTADMIMQSAKTTFLGGIIIENLIGQGDFAMGEYIYKEPSDFAKQYISNIVNSVNDFSIEKWSR